jgi:hypothetical protein
MVGTESLVCSTQSLTNSVRVVRCGGDRSGGILWDRPSLLSARRGSLLFYQTLTRNPRRVSRTEGTLGGAQSRRSGHRSLGGSQLGRACVVHGRGKPMHPKGLDLRPHGSGERYKYDDHPLSGCDP